MFQQEALCELRATGAEEMPGEIISGRRPQRLAFTSVDIPFLRRVGFFQETYDMLEIIILYSVSLLKQGSIIHLKNTGLFIFWVI